MTRPGRLVLVGDGAGGQGGEPVEQRTVRLAVVVVAVVVRAGVGTAGRGGGVGGRALRATGRGVVGEAADRGAVVGVAGDVEHRPDGVGGVGVAVAVVDPVDRAGTRIGREGALEVAAGAGCHESTAVDGIAVGREARYAALAAGVSVVRDGVDGPGFGCAGGGRRGSPCRWRVGC